MSGVFRAYGFIRARTRSSSFRALMLTSLSQTSAIGFFGGVRVLETNSGFPKKRLKPLNPKP